MTGLDGIAECSQEENYAPMRIRTKAWVPTNKKAKINDEKLKITKRLQIKMVG